jgi:triosephosphate isomerase (TIM)
MVCMERSIRKKIITGNWKMHKTIEQALDFVKRLIPLIQESDVQVLLAVPFTVIYPLTHEMDCSPLVIGAQNMNDASEGAFTGEIAAKMLKEAGAEFVLIGHSERRHIFKEDNAFINRKMKRAAEEGLRPVLCLGETLEEYKEQKTEEVIQLQLEEGLKDVPNKALRQLILAYEPVWAVGTGESATPDQAQAVHHFCREWLKERLGKEAAQQIIIQYGGSVTPSNAGELLSQPDIDGLLVGGASLSLETFSQIVNDSTKKSLNI